MCGAELQGVVTFELNGIHDEHVARTGIERTLQLEPSLEGNAYQVQTDRLPDNLTAALALWENSEWIAATFGEEVRHHYSNMARIELQAFGESVTDWERYRGFERL